MRTLLAEIYRRDRVLALAGWLFLGLLATLLVAAALDHRQLLGINVWTKPIKFAASIAIYLWTVAWLLGELPGAARAKSLIRWGTTVAMLFEIACIAGQAGRGTTSHFNNATPLDAAAFSVMGLFILFNTVLEGILLALFFRRGLTLAPAYLWGIRLGLIGALLSAGAGLAMIVHGAHTVGAADGGPGLWLLNWNTCAGDLRVAHAVALHALQVLPLFGYVCGRYRPAAAGLLATWMFAAAYLARPPGCSGRQWTVSRSSATFKIRAAAANDWAEGASFSTVWKEEPRRFSF